MKPGINETNHVPPFFAEADQLNQEVSFRDYLLKTGFTEYSPRLYMKENPLELIRLTKKKGQTHYRNFENKQDRGRLLDFIRNRSVEEGKIIPNNTTSAFLIAVEKARNFVQENIGNIKQLKQPRVILGANSSMKL